MFEFPLLNKLFLKIRISLLLNPLRQEQNPLKILFFPYCINEWNNPTVEIRNSKSVKAFKKLIKCGKKENSLFSINDPLGVKLLTCLRLQFSHLNEHIFRHGFEDIINAMCA